MQKKIKLMGIIALGVLVVMQFIRPDRNEQGYESIQFFENETKPSEKITSILKQNCYDCHSNHTIYPWYMNIAPVSYWINHHIEEGKEHFNISDWEKYSIKKKDHKLEELLEEVEEGHMPLSSYTWLHGNLEEEEKELLFQWVRDLRASYQSN